MLASIEAKIADFDDRYYRFSHQQRSFTEALTNARTYVSPYFPVKTLEEVTNYIKDGKLERCNDVRIVETFLLICDDLETLRLDFKRHLIDCLEINSEIKKLESTKKLVHCLKKWRKMLDSNYDFSELQAKWPHFVIQKLSSVEAKELYAGIVSFLPILLDNVKLAFSFLKDVDDKSVWLRHEDLGCFINDDGLSFRTSVSSMSKTAKTSRPATKTSSKQENMANMSEVNNTSRPVTVSNHSTTNRSEVQMKSVENQKSHRSSIPTFSRSRTVTAISGRSERNSDRPQTRSISEVVSSQRPKTSASGLTLGNVEFVDEDGISHGQSETFSPNITKKSRKISAAKRGDQLSKSSLHSLRQKLLSNPSDVSAIQEKLRSMYCKSSGSMKSIPDFAIRTVSRTPPVRVSETQEEGELSFRRRNLLTPIKEPLSLKNDSEKASRNNNDNLKSPSMNSEVARLSLPVKGVKKELTDVTPRKSAEHSKRPLAPSSRHLTDLLGRHSKSTDDLGKAEKRTASGSKKNEEDGSVISLVPSLKNFDWFETTSNSGQMKNNQTAAIVTPSSMSQKLTIPHTRGTDKVWQP